MNNVKLIFLIEWKLLVRSKSLPLLVFLMTASACYAIYYGTSKIKEQKAYIQYLIETNTSTKKSIDDYFTNPIVADTSKVGYNKMYTVHDPAMTEEYLNDNVAINSPNSFSSFSIGQRDVYPVYRKVSARCLYYDGGGISLDEKYSEITNPQKLMSGNFDLAFLFIYLFPLLVIALCFNLYSAEKEQGTLALISTQHVSLRHILFLKLQFRVLLVAGLVISYSVFAYFFSPVSSPDDFQKMLSWIGIVLLYQIFWFSLCYLVVGFKHGSASNALALFCCWLLILVIVPSAVNSYVESNYSINSRMVVLEELRDRTGDIWDLPNSVTYAAYFESYPAYKKEVAEKFPADGFDRMGNNDSLKVFYTQKFFVWHYYLDKVISKSMASYNQQLKAKTEAAGMFSFINPAITTQETLNDIAASGSLRYQHFRNETKHYRNILFEISNKYVFEEKKLSLADYRHYPSFSMAEEDIGKGYAKNSFVLVVLIFVLLVADYGRQQFYSIRKQSFKISL